MDSLTFLGFRFRFDERRGLYLTRAASKSRPRRRKGPTRMEWAMRWGYSLEAEARRIARAAGHPFADEISVTT